MSDLTQPQPSAPPAGATPCRPVSGLTPDVLGLLAAIRDMVTVPAPALDEDDRFEHRILMTTRLTELRIALDVALAPQWRNTTDPAREAAYLRDRIAASPVTYAVWQRPADAPADLEAGQEALRLRDGRLAEQRHQVLDPAVPVPAVVVGG